MKIFSFAEEISKALVSGGLDTGMGEYNGLPVITACCRDGKQAAFMPVDPASASPEEAVRDSEKVLAAIRTYRDIPRMESNDMTQSPGHEYGHSRYISAGDMAGTGHPDAVTGRPVIIVRDMWERRKEMMTARILAHCGIFRPVFARNCEVRRIDRATANSFLENTHSYGGASCRYCYGLFAKHTLSGITENTGQRRIADGSPAGHGQTHAPATRTAGPETDGYGRSDMQYPAGQMIAAAEFSNARKWIKGGRGIRSYEWIRYASLPYLRISGGMGKILKHFIQDVCPDDIMSYADLEWSDGQVYRQLGFDEEGTRAPVMFSIDRRIWIRTALNCHSVLNLRKPSDCNPGNRQSYCQLEHTQPDCHPEHTQPALPPGQEQRAMESERNTPTYYRNFGSLKFRLKLTGY